MTPNYPLIASPQTGIEGEALRQMEQTAVLPGMRQAGDLHVRQYTNPTSANVAKEGETIMFSTNVFQNSYSSEEDKLTYNFLCMIELMEENAQIKLLEFLLKSSTSPITLAIPPIVYIKPVFFWSGKGSNPDGCLQLRKSDGSEFSVFIEVKTYRRRLDGNQLKSHVMGHCTTANSLLLVITPRPGDSSIVTSLKDPKLLFITWQDIADFLSENLSSFGQSGLIAEQFVSYAAERGEFMGTEIGFDDIQAFSQFYRRHPEQRFLAALQKLAATFNFNPFFNPIQNPIVRNAWGRMVIEIQISAVDFEKCIAFGIYYDTKDHGIPWLKGIPELALFVDTTPGNRAALLADQSFVSDLIDLENDNFVENLTKSLTPNQWRLAWWRKPLDSYNKLDVGDLEKILTDLLIILKSKPNFGRMLLK